MAIPRVRGGQRAQAFILQARAAQAQGVQTVIVGFFETARYPAAHTGIRGGTARQPLPVAAVASFNEFGTSNGVPERPFMRRANETADPILLPIILAGVDSADALAIDRATAGRLGLAMQGHIQRTITDGPWRANAERTRERKSLRGNASREVTPLIDTAKMRNSVTYRIDDPEADAEIERLL